MRETEQKGLDYISSGALENLRTALDQILKHKDQHSTALTCSVCDKPITFETNGICADEHGKVAHTDCYVQEVIASTKRPVAPENQA
ncbi:MAG: hypothetical protein WAL56_00055 [Candidatus Sulfotelmatobacter sp.]